jgi:glucokinase
MTVLAGDIGGTKTLLAIADVEPGKYDVKFEKRYVSADYENLAPMVKEFLEEAKSSIDFTVENACFGIAGPVKGKIAKATNLPWEMNSDDMAKDLGFKKILLVNDFQSVGYAVEVLSGSDIVTLQEGSAQEDAARVVIGAGTGLGHGLLVWTGSHYEVLASEAGHVVFGPVNDLEVELLEYLRGKFGQVSYERVASGRGLFNIYSFLRDSGKGQETSELKDAIAEGDPSAAVSQFAMQNKDEMAVKALDMFCQIYGRQAGNMALTCMANGGVFVGGGVAPRIIDKLTDGTFITAFNNNDKMDYLLKEMPVKVIINANVGLIGSAVAASRI